MTEEIEIYCQLWLVLRDVTLIELPPDLSLRSQSELCRQSGSSILAQCFSALTGRGNAVYCLAPSLTIRHLSVLLYLLNIFLFPLKTDKIMCNYLLVHKGGITLKINMMAELYFTTTELSRSGPLLKSLNFLC